MKIIFINRYFYPDHSATSQILSDLAFELARRGYTITVVASRQLYDKPDVVLEARDTVGGVSVHRVKTTRFGRTNLAGRAVDYVTFYFSAFVLLARLVHKGDIVVAKTDHSGRLVPACASCELAAGHISRSRGTARCRGRPSIAPRLWNAARRTRCNTEARKRQRRARPSHG